MTTQAPNWYREKIRDMVRARYQARGGYLDGTMVQGDGGAGEVKFPVIGRVESYEISGAIQKITADIHRGSAPAAGAQKDRQQFCVAERARAPSQQLFPGPFLFRPVADRHTHLPVFAHTLVLPYDAPSLHNPPGRGQTTSTMVCVSHSPKYCTE